MPGLWKNVTGDTPTFGKNNFLRSTQPGTYTTNSRTIAKDSFPTETWGESTDQKILQPGEVLAKITSGPDAGKYGVFSMDTTGVTDGRSNPDNIVGINKSFYPYQLMDRDVEVANVYYGIVYQPWCTVRDAAGKRIPMPNSIADAFGARRDLNITFQS
ncbi:gp011 [Rhodococcus phage ReqiDocB7]|uniref:head decoration n=1 Tax=Rhodococcus phage ReqiDocB7 TaxID=691966 RepID=UPI0001CDD74D|nr:head decoration [Rhodococcus phage ReqiDocB7]ADD80797.1 gp011 [Rhodococcus phage ReqiDocB7]